MNDAYDKRLRALARQTASECQFHDFFREGTYAMVGGPMFETCAEARMLRSVGGDVVGMFCLFPVRFLKLNYVFASRSLGSVRQACLLFRRSS